MLPFSSIIIVILFLIFREKHIQKKGPFLLYGIVICSVIKFLTFTLAGVILRQLSATHSYTGIVVAASSGSNIVLSIMALEFLKRYLSRTQALSQAPLEPTGKIEHKPNTINAIYIGIWIFFIVAVLCTAGFIFKNGEPANLWWWLPGIGFLGWACIPFLMNLQFSMNHRGSVPALTVILIVMSIITFGGFYILLDAFVFHPDPQGGLVLIFLPILQIIISSIGIGIAFAVKRK